jgi:tetratricopeptide (TPR) repeat protein
VASRHARYFAELLYGLNESATILSIEDATVIYGEYLDNVRAALDWSFSADGDLDLAVALSAHSGTLFIELSLLAECRTWMLRASEIPNIQHDARLEMQVQAALGVSSMFTRGSIPEARRALERALDLALERDDGVFALGVLGMLNVFQQRVGDYQAALRVATQAQELAQRMQDPVAIMVAQWTVGLSYYLFGDHKRAQMNCESALLPRPTSHSARMLRFLGYDHRIRALIVLGDSLWMHGFPGRAIRAAQLLIQEAERSGQPIPICTAYISASSCFIRVGNLRLADDALEQAAACAERYSLLPYRAACLGMMGIIHIRKGSPALGTSMLEKCLEELYKNKSLVQATGFLGRLAEGKAMLGHFDEARETIETAISFSDARGDFLQNADLLRIRAEIMLLRPNPDKEQAEHHLRLAIDLSQRQFALSWELRAATLLGQLWLGSGRPKEAYQLVKGVYDRFTEGFETSDLRKAQHLLSDLSDEEGRFV